jgi:hypothetical protein
MTTLQPFTDEQINDAIAVIEDHNPRAALSVIAQLDEAATAKDADAFDHIAASAIQLAESLERDVQRANRKQSQPQDTRSRFVSTSARSAPKAAPKAAPGRRVLGIAALFFGICIWVPGAHYQLDGWTLVINALLDLVRSGYVLPIATGLGSLLLFPIGIIHSVGERKYLPLWKYGKRWQFLGWGVLVVWALINGADLLSAYIGIIQPPAADAWPITLRMSHSQWMQIAWMIVVVYIGDILIALGWRWLGIRLPWSR